MLMIAFKAYLDNSGNLKILNAIIFAKSLPYSVHRLWGLGHGHLGGPLVSPSQILLLVPDYIRLTP